MLIVIGQKKIDYKLVLPLNAQKATECESCIGEHPGFWRLFIAQATQTCFHKIHIVFIYQDINVPGESGPAMKCQGNTTFYGIPDAKLIKGRNYREELIVKSHRLSSLFLAKHNVPISGAQSTTKASIYPKDFIETGGCAAADWLVGNYMSMEIPISATGRTWQAFCPLSNITISMPKWSL